MKRVAALAGMLVAALLLGGCANDARPPSASSTPSTPSPHATTPGPTGSPTPNPLASLTLAQRVGQLFMVGSTASAAQPVTLDALAHRHVGNIFLSGRTSLGIDATGAVVKTFTALVNTTTTAGLPLLIATDQEGGFVQVLQGPGFSRIPSGLDQGAMSPKALLSSAQEWGGQLAAAGVNMDLAPVVDQVSSATSAPNNPPIGAYDREFGFDISTIEEHASAFRDGMVASNVVTVLKHFPGLGFVTANTDTSSGVTDTVTGPSGQNVGIYRNQIAARAPCIMISSAIYARIDGTVPAVFSRKVVSGLLRDRLGFTGVIMSDDLSGATQVLAWSPAHRAILAIEAGVDIVLVSKDPSVAAEMVDAVLAKAHSDPIFATLVDAAARKVIVLKSSPPIGP
ncbi:MAG: glycoside hydrolase family 3 N-terminal domain-containing protein [Terrimesophilobacter sp.]